MRFLLLLSIFLFSSCDLLGSSSNKKSEEGAKIEKNNKPASNNNDTETALSLEERNSKESKFCRLRQWAVSCVKKSKTKTDLNYCSEQFQKDQNELSKSLQVSLIYPDTKNPDDFSRIRSHQFQDCVRKARNFFPKIKQCHLDLAQDYGSSCVFVLMALILKTLSKSSKGS